MFASGKATINFPTNDIWGLKILSGKTLVGSNYSISFTDDGNFTNDFIAGWTNISLPTFGSGGAIFKDFTFGRRYQFDDILSPQPIDSTDIGMLSGPRIAATSRVAFDGVAALAAQSTGADFIVPPGAETILFTATWQTPDPNAKLRLIAPDGTRYDEGDFAAAGIALICSVSSDTGRAAGAAGLPAGTWRLEVVSALNLGQIDYEAVAGEAAPELTMGTVARDAGGAVTIIYALSDPDSNALLSLYATTDTPGSGGIMIASGLTETQLGSFVWNPSGVAPGLYTIYGVADDGANAPVTALGSGSVAVTGGTDLTVRLNPPTSVVGNQAFTLDISVGNIGDGLATGTKLRLELPQGFEFLGANATANVTGRLVDVLIGELASGAERDLTLTLRAPGSLGSVELSVSVSSDVFEQDQTDNMDGNTLSIIGGGNTLASSADGDLLVGGLGEDWATYALATSAVTVDLGAGSSSGGHGIDDLMGIEAVLGGAGADSLVGDAGSNTLHGGAGADTMVGGAGNDVFFVTDAGDLVMELVSGGADTIIASTSMAMPDHVEAVLIATGVSGITITGGAGNDMLIGNGLANNFNGGAFYDVIIAGNETLSYINEKIKICVNLEKAEETI
ncbi:MAG: CARDB domain-containing protein, partial [bacterium]